MEMRHSDAKRLLRYAISAETAPVGLMSMSEPGDRWDRLQGSIVALRQSVNRLLRFLRWKAAGGIVLAVLTVGSGIYTAVVAGSAFLAAFVTTVFGTGGLGALTVQELSERGRAKLKLELRLDEIQAHHQSCAKDNDPCMDKTEGLIDDFRKYFKDQ